MNVTLFRPSVSVVIKTYDNAERDFNPSKTHTTLKESLAMTLKALDEQTLLPCEILVVDSSVGDGIAQVIQDRLLQVDVRRIPLAQETFSYPRALNLGVQQAQGDIIVSLSGDATPADALWLEKLVAPLANLKVAGAFSRQIARPGTSPSWAERLRLWWRYRSRSVALRHADHLFSNACSAFRRDLAVQIPFDETLDQVEDYAWAREVQSQGYAIAYVGDSEVFHSHGLSSLKTVWRMLYYVYLRMKTDAGLRSK